MDTAFNAKVDAISAVVPGLKLYKIVGIISTFDNLREAGAEITEDRIRKFVGGVLFMEGYSEDDIDAVTKILL